ncbi:MAG: ribonuclease HII [Clostridiaceae bacterium]|nr:ribonuclease HII [Clostridiaceae bacterium]
MKKPTLKSLKEKADTMEAVDAFNWLTSLSEEYGDSVKKLADKYYKRMELIKKEENRLLAMSSMEFEAYEKGYSFIGGIDEAGRGPLAGPVVAACVILPPSVLLHKLNDSKKVSAAVRDELYIQIKDKAISYGIGIVENKIIDDINIYEATKKAMELAVNCMKTRPDFLIIDAVRLKIDIPQRSVPKADQNSVSVAAASILAKVTRDRMMEKLDGFYPGYGFAKHKGYGTAAHIAAIREKGLCPIHRISFTHNFV